MTVLAALRATPGLEVSEGPGEAITLVMGGKLDVIFLDEPIEKKMLFRLEARYSTPIHWFYRPEMIPRKEDRPSRPS
jgi:hypothetical protein